MTDTNTGPADRIPTGVLALSGVLLVVLSSMRWGIAPLAWIAPVPWMLWIRRTEGWKTRLSIMVLYCIASTGAVVKIVTEPIPLLFAPLYGMPLGVGAWMVLVGWDQLRRRLGETAALYAFPALAALSEWIGYRTSPMGVWGASASSQPDNLVLLQLASLCGVAGIAFVMAWVSAFVAAVLAAPATRWWKHGALLAGVFCAVSLFGVWRLAQRTSAPAIRVAGVVTDLGFGAAGLPTRSELDANLETLFQRSDLAVRRGARVVVWNEGATMVEKGEEASFLADSAGFARQHSVDLVVAYIVATSHDPFRFDNKAVFFADDGERLATYYKRHPVPGETKPSDNAVPRIERPYGIVSLAICYDHDFPEMALSQAAIGADLVLVPSSDWPGIDPLHTKLARVRAIEGGFSSFRPTRWAASGAFDPLGRARGWMRVDEQNDRVIVAELPVQRWATLYATLGDAPVGLAAAYLFLLVLAALSRTTSHTSEQDRDKLCSATGAESAVQP